MEMIFAEGEISPDFLPTDRKRKSNRLAWLVGWWGLLVEFRGS
jgi:hypothetical protein